MRNEQRRKKIKIILLTVGLIILAFALLFVGTELVKRAKISSFEVKAEKLTCTDKDQITKYLMDLELNYFGFKQDEFRTNLKKKFFCIGEVFTKVSYPNQLFLDVKGRQAAFAVTSLNSYFEVNPAVMLTDEIQIATESTKEATPVKVLDQILKDFNQASGSGTYLVDKDGMVFEEVTGSINFPRISILGEKLNVGREIPDNLIEKVDLLTQKLREIKLPTDNIIVIGDKLIVNSKPRLIFSLKKRLDYQTASLQLILSQAKMNSDPSRPDNVGIESVDLRFDKPVVVYLKK